MATLRTNRDSQGHLELILTEDEISYEAFPKWCRGFLDRYGGKTLEKIDGPDCRVQRVQLLGQELKLIFEDFPVQTCLLAESSEAEVVLNTIAELERRSYQSAGGNAATPRASA